MDDHLDADVADRLADQVRVGDRTENPGVFRRMWIDTDHGMAVPLEAKHQRPAEPPRRTRHQDAHRAARP
jgi:hypothetical protein